MPGGCDRRVEMLLHRPKTGRGGDSLKRTCSPSSSCISTQSLNLQVSLAHQVARRQQNLALRDGERDFNLRRAARRGRDAHNLKSSQCMVARSHRIRAAKRGHHNPGLAIGSGAENLRERARDFRAGFDEGRKYTAQSLNAQSLGRGLIRSHNRCGVLNN